MPGVLRVGLLGASRAAAVAMIAPAAQRADVEIVAVASRDAGRAQRFAAAHGPMRHAGSYDALIDAPDIDLIYIGTHAPTHAALALRAIAAGKHVLVEKPFATHVADAEAVAAAADARVFVAEAMHSLHHEAWRRLLALVAAGTIGAVRRIEAVFEEMTPDVPGEHRWQAEHGGGAMLDIGVYLVAFARAVAAAEPVDVAARVVRERRGVDAASEATLTFSSGASATLHCALDVEPTNSLLRVVGDDGEIVLDHLIVMHRGYRMVVTGRDGRREYCGGGTTGYAAQLATVTATVLHDAPFSLPPHDFVGNVRTLSRIREQFAATRRDR